eukprot:9308797-Pyramimonas_sp.AAC.1
MGAAKIRTKHSSFDLWCGMFVSFNIIFVVYCCEQPAQLKDAGVSHKELKESDEDGPQAEVQELLLSLCNDGMLYFLGDEDEESEDADGQGMSYEDADEEDDETLMVKR